MITTATQRVTAFAALAVTLVVLGAAAAPHSVTRWMRRSRSRGDVVGWVILAAGAATIAIMIVGYLTPKVQEYLNRIQ